MYYPYGLRAYRLFQFEPASRRHVALPLLLTKKSIASIGFIMYDYHNYPSILSFVEGDDSQLKKKSAYWRSLFCSCSPARRKPLRQRIKGISESTSITRKSNFRRPIMKNGVTFVQFRPLFQALDYKVNWNSGNKQVTGTYLDQKCR